MAIDGRRLANIRQNAREQGDNYDPYATDFTVSEVRHIIDETVMTDDERVLCDLFFVRQMKPNEVALVMDLSLKTAYTKKKELHEKMQETCKKLFLQ